MMKSITQSAGGGGLDICRSMETVIAAMAGGIIGRRVSLHALLGCLPDPFPEREACRSQPGRWELGGGPFQVCFAAHSLHLESPNLIVVSKGDMQTKDGRRAQVLMELSLAPQVVTSVAMVLRRGEGEGPLSLYFAAGPQSLTETAFSFEAELEGNIGRCPCAGCGYLSIVEEGRDGGAGPLPLWAENPLRGLVVQQRVAQGLL